MGSRDSGLRASSDDNTSPFGANTSADNHLVKGDRVYANTQIDYRFRSNDDDTIGVVFRFQDDLNFYLAFMSNGAYPTPPNGLSSFGRRTCPRPIGGEVPSSSAIPARTIFRDNPVARDTTEVPPRPMTKASAPASRRLVRSSAVPAMASKRRRMAASRPLSMAWFHHARPRHASPFGMAEQPRSAFLRFAATC
jgi:hypothetical protein